MKDDVRTYVEDLIKREFSTKSKVARVLFDNRQTNLSEHRNVQRRPILQLSVMKRTASKLGNKHEC